MKEAPLTSSVSGTPENRRMAALDHRLDSNQRCDAMLQNSAYLFLAQGSVLRVLNPDSPQARSIFDLGIVAGIILAIIFVIVAGIIVFALMRFRWREGEPDPHQLAGNRTVEIVWTAIPCLIVVVLFALTAACLKDCSLRNPVWLNLPARAKSPNCLSWADCTVVALAKLPEGAFPL